MILSFIRCRLSTPDKNIVFDKELDFMAHRVTDKLAVGSSESVYLCSHGHIHIQYRDLNIAMSKSDFVSFAETMSQALSEWNKKIGRASCRERV